MENVRVVQGDDIHEASDSVKNDLTTRRIVNESITHRLPPEILANIASHLTDDASLISATHVCRLWRDALLCSPRLWSHLTFANKQRALVFLERSKSAPLSVDLIGIGTPLEVVEESLSRITTRLTALRGLATSFVDALLALPLPVLTNLDIVGCRVSHEKRPILSLPSVRSFFVSNIDCPWFHIPHLTHFHFKWTHYHVPIGLGTNLLDFLHCCPLLEVLFLNYDVDLEFATDEVPTKAVSFHHLHSFTHETYSHWNILDRLSFPATCEVTFITDVTRHDLYNLWIPNLRTPHSSYLSDVRRVHIATYPRDGTHVMVETKFTNSKNMKFSFNRKWRRSCVPRNFYLQGFLGVLENTEIISSVESLHLENYPSDAPSFPLLENVLRDISQGLQKFCSLKSLVLRRCDTTLFLDPPPHELWCPTVEKLVITLSSTTHCRDVAEAPDIVKRVRDIAVARQKNGSPLRVITLSSRDPEIVLWECREEIEELRGCVESVEVVGLL